jgi:hypothetical protein
MSEPIPIACTLTKVGLRDRRRAWRRLLRSGLVDRRRVRGGVQLSPQQGAEAELVKLIELERECCTWMHVEVSEGGVVTVTSESPAGKLILWLMFLRFM